MSEKNHKTTLTELLKDLAKQCPTVDKKEYREPEEWLRHFEKYTHFKFLIKDHPNWEIEDDKKGKKVPIRLKYTTTNLEPYVSKHVIKLSQTMKLENIYEFSEEDKKDFGTYDNLEKFCVEVKKRLGVMLTANNGGNNIMNVAKRVLYRQLKFIACDVIKDYEYPFLDNVRNGFIYLKEKDVVIDHAYQYDINSAYPYALSNKKFRFPIMEGEKVLIKSSDEIDIKTIGLYMLDVDYSNFPYMHGNDDKKIYYSNYAIDMFRSANVPFTVIQPKPDEEHNAIIWNNDKTVTGDKFFGTMFKELYDLKRNGNKVASAISRMMHGILFQKNTIKIERSEYQPEMKKRLIRHEKGKLILLDDGSESEYKYGFARMKPFLYDFVRMDMFDTYINDADYEIHRIYIDSMLISKKLPNCYVGTKMGEMKFEKEYKNVAFHAVNQKPHFESEEC